MARCASPRAGRRSWATRKASSPTAPKRPIIVRPEKDRPQPRLDRDAENGMATVVGRISKDTIFDFKLTLISHNTIRGAAGAALLNAELLVAKNLL